jgi:hypothetical protein
MRIFNGIPSFCFPKYGTPLSNWQYSELRLFSQELADKLAPTGCWSDYNSKYRYYNWLANLEDAAPFFRSADLPLPPDTDDYSNLNC